MRSFIATCVVLGIIFVGMAMTCQHDADGVGRPCHKCGEIVWLD